MNEGFDNHACPKCGKIMVLEPFYYQWRWVCPRCGIEVGSFWFSNCTKEANDE